MADAPISARQLELLSCLASGLTIDQAAERCFVQKQTAYNSLSRARDKAGVRTLVQLAVLAVQEGWLEHRGRGIYAPSR